MESVMPIVNLRKTKVKKLEMIKKAGMNPYPAETKRTHTIEEAVAGFDRLAGQKTKLSLVGRIRSVRGQGALTFLHFDDGTGKIQALLLSFPELYSPPKEGKKRLKRLILEF